MSYKVIKGSFQKNMQKAQKQIQNRVNKVMKKSVVSAMQKDAEYVPPVMGQKSIPQKYYKRKIGFLPKTVKEKGNRHLKEDIEALHNGNRFKVEYKQDGTRKTGVWYFTTLRKAKKYIRIFNRGLWKFLFGANLEALGQTMPRLFRTLLNKSKNLANLKHLNQTTNDMKEDGTMNIKVQNLAKQNDKFSGNAEKYADIQFKKTFKRLYKQETQKDIQV